MSIRRVLKIFRKDMRLGPRSPVFLYALLLPVMMTFVIQVVFASLFNPVPRLGIVDKGTSALTTDAQALEGIEVTLLDDAEELKAQVEANDLDAGVVLQADFDRAVRSGERPDLEFYIGGESLASNRVILGVTALDLVREVEGKVSPVDVVINDFGEAVLPLSRRLIPLVLMYSFIMAGVFLPAFAVAQEREQHTLSALVVTPVRLPEILAGKALMGLTMAVAMAVVTLGLNQALGASPVALIAAIVVAAIMSTMIGLVFATGSKDVTMLYALIKGTGILIMGPVVFYIFPSWPQWIAKLFPTYWFIDPIYQVAIRDAALSDVAGSLGVALAISAVLVLPVIFLARRLQGALAAEG